MAKVTKEVVQTAVNVGDNYLIDELVRAVNRLAVITQDEIAGATTDSIQIVYKGESTPRT